MLQHELIGQFDALKESLDNSPMFLACAHELNKVRSSIDGFTKKIAEGGDKLPNHAHSIHAAYAAVPAALQSIEVSQFFLEGHRLSAQLESIELELAQGLLKSANRFTRYYSEFLGSRAMASAAALVDAGSAFSYNAQVVKTLVADVKDPLTVNVELGEEQREFALYLGRADDLRVFASKLVTLLALYDELCMLMGVSADEYPLSIIKVESGSLWVKVFGHAQVIAVLVALVTGAAGYFHRNYTNEGRIERIATSVEALDRLFEFQKKLKENGVDTAASEAEIQKGAHQLAKGLNELLIDQTKVQVDARVIELSPAQEIRYLENSKLAIQGGPGQGERAADK